MKTIERKSVGFLAQYIFLFPLLYFFVKNPTLSPSISNILSVPLDSYISLYLSVNVYASLSFTFSVSYSFFYLFLSHYFRAFSFISSTCRSWNEDRQNK